MTDYISREAAIEAVKKERDYTGKFTFEEEHAWAVGFQQGITFALSDIAAIPAADVRPVVLCENCQYCIIKDAFEYWCNGFCSPARLVCHDDFCSRGVKKDETMCWL